MLDKTYRPAAVEARIYAAWEAMGAFAPSGEATAPAYCIMLPAAQRHRQPAHGPCPGPHDPGHLVRFHRMRGADVLWQPGTDHAGIATQMVVERQLAAAGNNRAAASMGREAFVAKVWEWREQSGGTIAADAAARRLAATGPRALHHGRGPTRRCCKASSSSTRRA